MIITLNIENIEETAEKCSLLSNRKYLKLLLQMNSPKSVKEIHKHSSFCNYSSTYKALQKLARANIVKKEKGLNQIGDVYFFL